MIGITFELKKLCNVSPGTRLPHYQLKNMKTHNSNRFAISLVALAAFGAASAHAALIAHYTFDSVFDTDKTADSVGSGNFATIGTRVGINTTSPLIGAGALEMNGGNGGTATGALTNNAFTFATDVRTVSFWWKSDNIGQTTDQGTFVGMGTNNNGTRFDIKEQTNNTNLRIEIGGGGINSLSDIHDQTWQHIAIVVPLDGATLNDVIGYVDGVAISDFTADNSAINTATAQLLFGSTVGSTGAGRVPQGLMDDFQLYDEALSQSQVQSLFNNPGSVIPEPSTALLGGLGALLLLRRRRH